MIPDVLTLRSPLFSGSLRAELLAEDSGPETAAPATPPIAFPTAAERRARRVRVRLTNAHRPELTDEELRLLAALRGLSQGQRANLWPWFKECEATRTNGPAEDGATKSSRICRERQQGMAAGFAAIAGRPLGPDTTFEEIQKAVKSGLGQKRLARMREHGIVTIGDAANLHEGEHWDTARFDCVIAQELFDWVGAAGLTFRPDPKQDGGAA